MQVQNGELVTHFDYVNTKWIEMENSFRDSSRFTKLSKEMKNSSRHVIFRRLPPRNSSLINTITD